MSYGEPIDKLAEANKQIVHLQQYLREANEEKDKLNKIIDELREQKVDLQDRVSGLTKNVVDVMFEAANEKDTNKKLLIDVCECFTSAEDKDMNESELENWVVQVGIKLNTALSNYK